jgi:hypothetical protein
VERRALAAWTDETPVLPQLAAIDPELQIRVVEAVKTHVSCITAISFMEGV